MIELLSHCLTSSYIVFIPLKYMRKFQGIFYLTKFEEPEHPLDTGGELLSVSPTVLSLEMDGGNIIPLKKATQKDVKGKDFTIRSE